MRDTCDGPHVEGGGVVVVGEGGGDFAIEVRTGVWGRGVVWARKCRLDLAGVFVCFFVLSFVAEHCGSGGRTALLYRKAVGRAGAMRRGERIKWGAVGL